MIGARTQPARIATVPIACIAVMVLAGACGFGSSTFSVGNASVDASYSCPDGASNSRYDLHATVPANNGTSKAVTIKTVSATMTLEAVRGTWLQKVGDKYDAGEVAFSPSSVAAGSNATLNATIPSACTHGQGATGTNYGEYEVGLTVSTSIGVYRLTARNRHRILA